MPVGTSMPMVGLNFGSLNELYFLLVEYSLNDFPWSFVHSELLEVVVVCAETAPAPARSKDAVAIDNSDFLIGYFLICGWIQGLAEPTPSHIGGWSFVTGSEIT